MSETTDFNDRIRSLRTTAKQLEQSPRVEAQTEARQCRNEADQLERYIKPSDYDFIPEVRRAKHNPHCDCGICAYCNGQEDIYGNPSTNPPKPQPPPTEPRAGDCPHCGRNHRPDNACRGLSAAEAGTVGPSGVVGPAAQIDTPTNPRVHTATPHSPLPWRAEDNVRFQPGQIVVADLFDGYGGVDVVAHAFTKEYAAQIVNARARIRQLETALIQVTWNTDETKSTAIARAALANEPESEVNQ